VPDLGRATGKKALQQHLQHIFYVMLQAVVEFRHAMLKNVCILLTLLHFLTPRTLIHCMKTNKNNV